MRTIIVIKPQKQILIKKARKGKELLVEIYLGQNKEVILVDLQD